MRLCFGGRWKGQEGKRWSELWGRRGHSKESHLLHMSGSSTPDPFLGLFKAKIQKLTSRKGCWHSSSCSTFPRTSNRHCLCLHPPTPFLGCYYAENYHVLDSRGLVNPAYIPACSARTLGGLLAFCSHALPRLARVTSRGVLSLYPQLGSWQSTNSSSVGILQHWAEL